MFGFGSSAPVAPQPPVDPAVALQAQPNQPPQQAPLPGQPGYSPSKLDMLMDVLWNGHSPMDASLAVRGRDATVYQQQLMRDVYTKAQQQDPSGHTIAAMLFNPGEYGKSVAANYAPVSTAAGATQTMYGGPTVGGSAFMAPEFYRDDKSGTVGVQTQGGNVVQDRLGGDVSAANGLILSGRQGPLGTYSTPQTIAPGSTGVPFSPTVSGVGAPAIAGQPTIGGPGPGATPAPPQGGAMPANAPRGLRNNNPGNIMTLPSGHMWDGQTGVDPEGYAVFGTPEAGMKAAATNLNTYATRHAIDTVAGVVNRWAPASAGNNTGNYATYIAQRMGVAPDQKLNMSDPRVQHGILGGIFSFENGPQAMAGWQPQATPAATQAAAAQPAGQPAQGAGYGQPFAEGRQPRILSPEEARQAGFAPGAVVEEGPDHKYAVVQSPEYGPEQKSSMRNQVLTSDEYKQAQAAMAAYGSMIANAKTMTGPSAYAMLDTFARAINPGAVARPQVIQTIEQNLGIPAQVVGRLQSMAGQGNLPPQVRQQIIDAVVPFAQSHWDQANRLNQANTDLARSHGFNAADVTAPLEARPRGVSIAALEAGIPPPDQRKAGQSYNTPRGPMRWTGTGWVPAGGR